MSIHLIDQVWKTPCESHAVKLLLIALADVANDEGFCWPGLNTLARKCDLSRQGVIDQIEKLEKSGFLIVNRQHGSTNQYQIVLEKLPESREQIRKDFKEAHQGEFLDDCPKNNQSTALTTRSQRGGPLGVNGVDYHQSTALTRSVIDPSIEPSVQPPEGVTGELWKEWIKYRKKLGKVKDWKSLFKKQAEWISDQPTEDRIEIINQSLRQGWQGLFPLKRVLKQNQSTEGKPSGMDKMIAQKEFDRVVDRMRVLKASYGEMQTWSTADGLEFKKLVARRNELKKILGITI